MTIVIINGTQVKKTNLRNAIWTYESVKCKIANNPFIELN